MRPLDVLIGCEESATVREAFRRLGHNAVSCDLSPSRVPGPHLQCDLFDVIEAGWDLAIVHPPCTYLSSSGLHWNKRPGHLRFGGRQTDEALEFVRRVMRANVKRLVIENPIGCIGTRIRKADQIIQPYEFGDDASKATCLWVRGGLPLLVPTKRVPGRVVEWKGKLVERWSNQTDSGQSVLGESKGRAQERSVTFPGVADAMASQWSAAVLNERLAA